MLDVVREYAPAKINSHLQVYPERSDGYHPIEIIFQTVSLFDELKIEFVGESFGCVVKCDSMQLPEENTLTKTYKVFCQETGIKLGISVELTKQIPSGAGLGGGSSDAAYFLRALNRACDYPLSQSRLEFVASLVGSDVPFFLFDGAAIVTGRGEKVKPILPRKDLCFVLVYPDVHCSTAECYSLVDGYYALGKAVVGPTLQEIEEMYYKPISEWRFINTFANPVMEKYPAILDALRSLELQGAEFVQMSGSGSTVFGVFSDDNLGKDACTNLRKKWKNVYFLSSSIQQDI